MVCSKQTIPHHFNFFKGFFPQIYFGPFLNAFFLTDAYTMLPLYLFWNVLDFIQLAKESSLWKIS